MKKLFFVFCLIPAFALTAFAQDYKITEPYGTTETSGKLAKKSGQKYTYLYDTSLIQAIKLKDEHRVKILMYAQVNPNEKNDEGFTPLYFAAQYVSPETLAMIIDKGAKVNLTSTYNLTPLMAAAAAGRADNVQVLLEYGADPNLVDDKDLTALDHAFNNHQLEPAILLNPITTVKKSTLNYDAWIDESMNGQAAYEHMTSPEPVETPASVKDAMEAAAYNPTLAEIDAKIEQTRQALGRLIALRKQIADAEEKEVVETTTETPVQTKTTVSPTGVKTTTTYSKTTTTKTTTTKNKKPAKVATSVNN
ncbi:MAG: ankyrin repeat domain-containing protein [Elusimicrobiaceae bacterium]|nr:ankyrin repeat domain-containing protein [Elusimicrobiaceae bacterium]